MILLEVNLIKKIDKNSVSRFTVSVKEKKDIYKDLNDVVNAFLITPAHTFLCSIFSEKDNKFSFFFIENVNEKRKTIDAIVLNFKIRMEVTKFYSTIKEYYMLTEYENAYDISYNTLFGECKLEDIIENKCNVEYYL